MFFCRRSKTYATVISNAIDRALSSKYCQCGSPDKTGEQMIDIIMENTGSNQASAVEGRAELYTKDALEEEFYKLSKELEQSNGAIMGTAAGDKFAALKAKRDALRNGVQSWYSHGNLISRSQNVDCSKVREDTLPKDEGVFISSYNFSQSTTTNNLATANNAANQTFITPTDIFVAAGQSTSDSKEALIAKCLAACKTKGGNAGDCNKICNVPHCGCRDTDNNGSLEAVCEAAQFGPECMGVANCNIRMCDDSALASSLTANTNLSALVSKYYPNSNIGKVSTNVDANVQVAQVSSSKKCTTGGCDITLTSAVDNQFQAAYIKWDTGAQDASLVTDLMATNGRIELAAGKPKTIHLDTTVANELQLSSGTRIECLSCNGDMTLANRFSSGCDKAGETNPHAECRASYDCTQSEPTYGCYNFYTCGVNECNDYLPDKYGNKPVSADCKASSSGQKWKCKSRQNCIAASDGSYATKSECLSSLECGGGGTGTERNTYYCCDESTGSCSQCTEGSPRYVNPAQCNNDCSKTTCPTGQTKCGTTCCRDIDQVCGNYTTCKNVFTCEGICCINGCDGDKATGLCGGTGVSCCATGCK